MGSLKIVVLKRALHAIEKTTNVAIRATMMSC